MAKRKSKAARGGKVQLTFRNLKKPEPRVAPR
jgi:hypothetical protein